MEGLRNGSLPKRWTCLSCCCCLFTACALRCCLKTRRSCSCHSPLIPRPNRRQEQKQAWRQAHNRNIRLAENASQQTDVVFLGDSITERFLGTDLEELRGRHRDKVQAFQELFTRAGGGTVDGVPLGISGDRVRRRRTAYQVSANTHLSHPTSVLPLLCCFLTSNSTTPAFPIPAGFLVKRITLFFRTTLLEYRTLVQAPTRRIA
mmetsp:Transcript_13691/g.31828  ORF Transcript_13691/g.31828 Transcript_13691/m.31828 type:complete len:205 (+) Transcript_13691:379-993(+)